MSLLIDNMDESVGEMLPQVDLNGQPLTREYYIKEWENGSEKIIQKVAQGKGMESQRELRNMWIEL